MGRKRAKHKNVNWKENGASNGPLPPPFKYEPLYQVHERKPRKGANEAGLLRVIEVLPDEISGMIQLSMRRIKIGEPYTCLSYPWGSPKDRTTDIIIIEPERQVKKRGIASVRSNLYALLQVARVKYHSRPIWIDALCIDQGNRDEKNRQVRQMGDVYRNADQVIAWLGKDSRVSRLLREVRQNSKYTNSIPTDELCTFKNLPYWERAWITQEIVLAKKVTLTTDEEELDYALIPVELRTTEMPPPNGILQGQSLIYLLERFMYKKCAMPVDRVFSLLDLCDKEEKKAINVDYGLSSGEVLVQTLKACHHSLCLCTLIFVRNALTPMARSRAPAPYFDHREIPLQTFVELQLKPVLRYHYCRDYINPKRKFPDQRNFSEGFMFCQRLSSVCGEGTTSTRHHKDVDSDTYVSYIYSDFMSHFFCALIPATGKYRVYLPGCWKSDGLGGAWWPACYLGEDLKSEVDIREGGKEGHYKVRMELRTLVLIMESDDLWVDLAPHPGMMRFVYCPDRCDSLH